MPDTIKDGRGKGFLVAVNSDQQLITRATAVEQRLISTIDENYFEATTGQITLTDAAETGIIYILNSETLPLVIDRTFVDIWTSTDGSGADGTLKYYRNPTYTGGSAIVPWITNFNSNKALDGTFLKSLSTIAGDVWWTGYITDKSSIIIDEGRILIPPGRSFGISVAAPTGNTSMKISINIAMYLLDTDLVG